MIENSKRGFIYKKIQLYAVPLFCAFITFLVYLPALQNDFVYYDDDLYIFDNFRITKFDMHFIKWAFTTFYCSNWHPLTWFSHALDYALWGINPAGHHFTNMVLHALNTFLVALLAIRLLETILICQISSAQGKEHFKKKIYFAALITGLLFGLHPLHVESVAWASERKDVLCAFLFLLSILTYIHYANTSSQLLKDKSSRFIFLNKWFIVTLCLFILALLSKPMAVTLPFVLLLMDWFPLKRFQNIGLNKIFLEKLPFIVLSIEVSVITVFAQYYGKALVTFESSPLSARIIVSFKSLALYIEKMIYPDNLTVLYPYPDSVSIKSPEFFFPIIFVVFLTFLCFFYVKKRPAFAAAWFYFLITLLPVLGIVRVGPQSIANRYMYLPSIAPFLLIGIGIAYLVERLSFSAKSKNGIQIVSLIILVGIYSPLTINQIGTWKDSVSILSRVISFYPGTAKIAQVAYNNLGLYYISENMPDKAIEILQKGINKYPEDSVMMSNLGAAYIKAKMMDRGLKALNDAIKIDPKNADIYFNLGTLYIKQNRIEDGITSYIAGLKLKPDNPKAYNDLATAYDMKGNKDAAILCYQKAVDLRLNYHEAYNSLGVIYIEKKMYKKARENIQRAVDIKPDFSLAHYNLAVAYLSDGYIEKAKRHLQIYLTLEPDDNDAKEIFSEILERSKN